MRSGLTILVVLACYGVAQAAPRKTERVDARKSGRLGKFAVAKNDPGQDQTFNLRGQALMGGMDVQAEAYESVNRFLRIPHGACKGDRPELKGKRDTLVLRLLAINFKTCRVDYCGYQYMYRHQFMSNYRCRQLATIAKDIQARVWRHKPLGAGYWHLY